MKSRRSRPSAPVSAASAAPDLTWVHDGIRQRVSVWPEVAFEQEIAPGCWERAEPCEAALASAALGVGASRWRRYLEFVPTAEREFLHRFQFSRMAALAVIVQCPALFDELACTPALTAFVAAHHGLRGGSRAAWAEIAAVYDRDGVFGLLQWLGLPASRQTLTILRNISDPDLPHRLLEPLRSALWEPAAIWALSQAPALTDESLAETCHALAA
jgi:hypothetical protein